MGQFTVDLEKLGAPTDRDFDIDRESKAAFKEYKDNQLTMAEFVRKATENLQSPEELFLMSQAIGALLGAPNSSKDFTVNSANVKMTSLSGTLARDKEAEAVFMMYKQGLIPKSMFITTMTSKCSNAAELYAMAQALFIDTLDPELQVKVIENYAKNMRK